MSASRMMRRLWQAAWESMDEGRDHVAELLVPVGMLRELFREVAELLRGTEKPLVQEVEERPKI